MTLGELIQVLGYKIEGEQNLTRFQAGIDRARSKMAAFTAAATAMAAVAGAAIGAAGVRLAKGAIETGATFEKLEATLETIEGSSAKAKAALKWVADFTKTTPYELNDVSESFVKLRSYGLDPMNGLLRSLGDASSAMGKPLIQAVEAVADAVTGENERLKEFGITSEKAGNKITYTWQQNGKTMTKTVKKDGKEIQKALTEIFNARFRGAMERQAATYNGIVSNLADSWTDFKLRIANAGWFDFVKTQLTKLADLIKRLDDNGTIDRVAKGLSTTFIAVANAALRVGRALGDLAKWMSNQGLWTPIAIGFALLLARASPLARALTAIVLALDDIQAYREGAASTFGDLVGWLEKTAGVAKSTAEAIAGIGAAILALALIKPGLIFGPLIKGLGRLTGVIPKPAAPVPAGVPKPGIPVAPKPGVPAPGAPATGGAPKPGSPGAGVGSGVVGAILGSLIYAAGREAIDRVLRAGASEKGNAEADRWDRLGIVEKFQSVAAGLGKILERNGLVGEPPKQLSPADIERARRLQNTDPRGVFNPEAAREARRAEALGRLPPPPPSQAVEPAPAPRPLPRRPGQPAVPPRPPFPTPKPAAESPKPAAPAEAPQSAVQAIINALKPKAPAAPAVPAPNQPQTTPRPSFVQPKADAGGITDLNEIAERTKGIIDKIGASPVKPEVDKTSLDAAGTAAKATVSDVTKVGEANVKPTVDDSSIRSALDSARQMLATLTGIGSANVQPKVTIPRVQAPAATSAPAAAPSSTATSAPSTTPRPSFTSGPTVAAAPANPLSRIAPTTVAAAGAASVTNNTSTVTNVGGITVNVAQTNAPPSAIGSAVASAISPVRSAGKTAPSPAR